MCVHGWGVGGGRFGGLRLFVSCCSCRGCSVERSPPSPYPLFVDLLTHRTLLAPPPDSPPSPPVAPPTSPLVLPRSTYRKLNPRESGLALSRRRTFTSGLHPIETSWSRSQSQCSSIIIAAPCFFTSLSREAMFTIVWSSALLFFGTGMFLASDSSAICTWIRAREMRGGGGGRGEGRRPENGEWRTEKGESRGGVMREGGRG